MSEHAPKEKPLPTTWRVPDELWERIEPILAECHPPKGTGRRRIDQRAALEGIIFRLRTGCQWNHLPKKEFPENSSVHRTFQRWSELGVLERIWVASVKECEELGGVDWEWQAADGAMGKARLGDLIGPNPTDRAKNGVKRSLLVEADEGPLAVVIAGANVRDYKLCWPPRSRPSWSSARSRPRRGSSAPVPGDKG